MEQARSASDATMNLRPFCEIRESPVVAVRDGR